MRKNKKAFLIMIIFVVTAFLAATITTTYAWFLSRYTKNYDFVLDSQSMIILKYESDLTFASGDISTPTNVLIPAKAKQLTGINQETLSSWDVFDVDTVSPAHTGKVATSAQAVRFVAEGAYWTGTTTTVGYMVPELRAYTSAFLTGEALSDHLESFSEETELTEENLLSVLSEEAEEKTAQNRLIARNDLVGQGEIDYFMIFSYREETILYYDGTFYYGDSEDPALTLSSNTGLDVEQLEWSPYPNTDSLSAISNGTRLLLQPNTTFSYTLYVFVAKTDEELDPAINGERISFFASLKLGA